MFEIVIDGVTYGFQFGMQWMRKTDQTIKIPVEGFPNVQKNAGLRYQLARILDGEMDAIVDSLYLANEGQQPRVTKSLLDSYIDNPDTDIDQFHTDLVDFLKNANAIKKPMTEFLKALAANNEQ